MSIQYHLQIKSDPHRRLVIHFSGIDADSLTNASDLTLHMYWYDSVSTTTLFTEVLNHAEILSLYQHLNKLSIIRDATKNQSGKFIEITDDLEDIIPLLDKANTEIISSVIKKIGSSKENLGLIAAALGTSEIDFLNATINQSKYVAELEVLKELISLDIGNIVEEITKKEALNNYFAKQPEKIFQNWIEKNLWVLGLNHFKKFDSRKIGLDSDADLVLESIDGYIDLIELKRPIFTILSHDSSHNSYYPSPDTAKAIGQSLKYLKVLDDFKFQLQDENDYKILRPRIRIIAGRSDKFDNRQNEALRLLNSGLNSIEIISYDHLVKMGESIISHYSKPLEK